MFIGSFLFGGKFHSCQRAGMCMLSLISEDGNSIKLIKQALAYRNKTVTLKYFQKQVVRSCGGGGELGVILVLVYKPVF